MGDTALLTLGADAEARGAGRREMPSLPLSRTISSPEQPQSLTQVASCTRSIGLWRSPMDFASETTNAAFRVPVPAQRLSLYLQLQGKPGPAPIFLSGICSTRLHRCCCRTGLHHTQRRKGEESRHQSLLKMFECMGWFYL